MIQRALFLAVLSCRPIADSASSGSGTGTVSGSFAGMPFDSIGAAFHIGAADDPTDTIVVELFDQPVACDAISSTGWDTRLDGVQALELKMVGTTQGAYPVSGGPSPGKGEADANYTLTATNGTPSETSATAGSVVVDAVVVGADAQGTFDLTFPNEDALTGTFDAAWCAGGREP